MSILPDFQPSPLDFYRKKASFDWKKLKLFIDTEDVINYQNELYNVLENHPEYQKDIFSDTFEEERYKAARQVMAHKKIEILSLPYIVRNFKFFAYSLRTMTQIAPSSAIKYSVGNVMFSNAIRTLGSERHEKFVEGVDEDRILGCFCLTEIGHGSNTKDMRTTATYDKEKKQFILNTPDFEAAKCWAGGLGMTATHGVVFAQLYLDGRPLGLHPFVVPMRNPRTLLPYPGVIVGDMGEKIGLNGIDNGFVIFDNYHIPRECLLNRTGDVSEDGKYVSPIKTANERVGASFSVLSAGRVNIVTICESLGTKAITIAIRYAAIRKQFGPEGQGEIPILEYQSHQHRLLPYLASCLTFRIFGNYLLEQQLNFSAQLIMGNKTEEVGALGLELHGLSSACKPLAGWLFRDGIQECREACGGHGYLKAAGIGDIRNDHDANCTYEGENHVLIQQTSNWLLKLFPLIESGKKINSPMGSLDFLYHYADILKHKFSANSVQEICRPEKILDAWQWLVCYLLKITKERMDLKLKNGTPFSAKNETQVYYAKSLGIAYIQQFILQRVAAFIKDSPDPAIEAVLSKIFSLYGLWSLVKFLRTLYQGGYAVGPNPTSLIQEAILMLCTSLKDDAIALVDVIAPPDFILNSVLGSSDGQVYKRLQSAIYRSPIALGRPPWWKEVVNWKLNKTSKL